MNKFFVVCFVAFAFVLTFASVSFGRTLYEEQQAVRDYLNVVDAKLATAKQANNKARVDLLHQEKAATLARWYKLKNAMEVAPAPVPPPPAPAPVIIYVQPTAEVNRNEVGRGVALYVNGGLDAGLTGFAANLDYDLSGLPAQGLKLRIGANYVSGTNPRGNDDLKVVSAKLGAIYYITPYLPDLGLPLTWYIGGAYLLPVKVNNNRNGGWGMEAYLGANYNIPEMGIINFEIGYSGLKYTASEPALKGMDLKIGYGIAF